MSAATPARLIDHALGPHLFADVEPFGYLGMVSLATGTLLLWIGSAYEHVAGLVIRGAHVLQVLNGELRGECVEIRVEEVDQSALPDTMPPAGGTQPVYRVSRRIAEGVWTTDRRYSLDPGTHLRRIEVVQYLDCGSCAGPFLSSVGRYEVLDGGAPGTLAEITHATTHDDVGPIIEEHPDLEAVAYSRPNR